MDKGNSKDARNSRANDRRNTYYSMGGSNSMDKGKIMDACNSRASKKRNTCNIVGAGNSIRTTARA
jgi:hypothetical protein